MDITILGSGGFMTIPRPLCQCRVCSEARAKGHPYTRNGPSIYIKELAAVIDTPKDITSSLNREGVTGLKRIFYTHWHPDHTEGMRVVEEATNSWSKRRPYTLQNHGEPIKVIIPEPLEGTIKGIRSPKGSYLEYFERKGFVKTHTTPYGKDVEADGTSITPMEVNEETACYVLREGGRKAVYMPCDVKPHGNLDFLKDADVLIVGSPYLEAEEGLGQLPPNHPLRNEVFSMDEIVNLIEKNGIKRTVITHIEEMWGLSHDDYQGLEKWYQKYGIAFSYDGMRIVV